MISEYILINCCFIRQFLFNYRIEKKVGDHVAVDEVIMEIETDKTSMPVPSPGSGIIEAIFVKDGDTVKPGMDLFKINITGEAPPAKAAAPKAAAPSAPSPPPAAGKIILKSALFELFL